LIWTFYP